MSLHVRYVPPHPLGAPSGDCLGCASVGTVRALLLSNSIFWKRCGSSHERQQKGSDEAMGFAT